MDLLDLTLFVDWMGKADMDKELRPGVRKRSGGPSRSGVKIRGPGPPLPTRFSALEHKVVHASENFDSQDWAKLLLVFGMHKLIFIKCISRVKTSPTIICP